MAALTFVHKGVEKAKLKGGEKDEDHAHLVVKVRQRNLKRRLGKASKKIRNIFSAPPLPPPLDTFRNKNVTFGRKSQVFKATKISH